MKFYFRCIVGEADAGIINPSNDLTYQVVEGIYSELIQLFPSFIHIGADEVKLHCWTDNSTFVNENKEFWESRNISPYDTNAIGHYYFSSTLSIFNENNRDIIAWFLSFFIFMFS